MQVSFQEYQRIAQRRDEIAQTLFSAALIADVLPRLWERDPNEGRLRLGELRALTHTALHEMTRLMVELQSPNCHLTQFEKDGRDDQRGTIAKEEDPGLAG